MSGVEEVEVEEEEWEEWLQRRTVRSSDVEARRVPEGLNVTLNITPS